MKNIPYELIARYLAGECSDDEKQQVMEWSRQNPDQMNEFEKMWEQIPSDEFNPDIELALQKVNTRIDTRKEKKPKRLFFLMGGAAAAIAVIFILMNIFTTSTESTIKNFGVNGLLTLSTNMNETVEYQLSDGSKIWLNQSSSIHYPEAFTGDTREIYLEGEAFFDIASNPEKPFIIHANNTQTRVVGTSFGIRAVKEEREVVVTVSSGIINFSTEGKSDHIELKKGEQGICNTEEKKLEKNENPDPNLLAWKTKVIIFNQTSLSEVGKILENVYHIPVSVDDSVANLQITSTFDQLSVEEVLQIIELTLQVKAEKDEEEIRITKN